MVLGISEQDMLNKNKLKIIDSVAGASKSSQTHAYLESQGIKYLRLTSTNTLKKDAEQRFGGAVKTICAGLFDNKNGFRSEEKEVEGFDTIVIDEILQDSVSAIRWCHKRIGQYNIIITCDSRQLLAVESEEAVKAAFEALKNDPRTVYSNINKSLRGVNQKTRDEVERLYLEDGSMHGYELLTKYKSIKLDDMKFDCMSAYICHTNDIERHLYRTYSEEMKSCELIGKGQQSGKEPVIGKYPILDEYTAKLKHVLNYYQVKSIGSAPRWQGSEVHQGQKGYFLIEQCSSVSMRELYTVVSRFKDIDDLTIVDCTGYDKIKRIEKLQGKDVKEMKSLIVEKFDGKMHVCNDEEMIEVISKAADKSFYYNIDTVYAIVDDRMYLQYVNEKSLKRMEKRHNMEVATGNLFIDLTEKPKIQRSIAASLLKKCPSVQYDFIDRVYDKVGTTFKAPMLKNEDKRADEYEHQADMFSAYATVIKNCKMPTNKAFYEYYDKDKLNWYICNSKKLVGIHNLITEDLAAELHMDECKFVFATDYQISNEIGDYVYEQTRKSKEAKKKLNMHWGYYEKKYIEMKHSGYMHDCEAIREAVPVMNKSNINELFMCAIKSSLAAIMYRARESVGGGCVVTDAIYYDGDIKPDFPDWVWYRISKSHKTEGEYQGIEYQNYEDLKTEKELKNEKEKAKIAALDDDEAAARKARRAEAERARRAAKKAAETTEQAEERRRNERERKARQRQS